MHRGGQALVEFGESGVWLGSDQGAQLGAAVIVDLGLGATGMRPGGNGTGFAAALQQAADPGRADPEEVGNLLAGTAPRIARADHPLTEVLGVRSHTQLEG